MFKKIQKKSWLFLILALAATLFLVLTNKGEIWVNVFEGRENTIEFSGHKVFSRLFEQSITDEGKAYVKKNKSTFTVEKIIDHPRTKTCTCTF